MIINKKIQAHIKLRIVAGSATPSPPIGPSLGQQGLNIMDFCKEFNSRTMKYEKGTIVPVVITVYSDRSFSFIIKTTPTTLLIKKAVGISSGSSKAHKTIVGKLLMTQVYDIAKIKSLDMTGSSIELISKSIIGTARSMGIEVDDN